MFNVHINTLVVSELSLSSQSLALTDSLTRTTKVVGWLVGWLVFNGTFRTDRLNCAISVQEINLIIYLV